MSVNSLTSNSAIYQSLLKALDPNAKDSTDYAKATQSKTFTQPTPQDIKDLLARLAGAQPSLMDMLNNDSSSSDSSDSMDSLDSLSLLGSSVSSDSSDSLDSLDSLSFLDPSSSSNSISALLGFDSQNAALNAFSDSDTDSDSGSSSTDSLTSMLSLIGGNLSASDLSTFSNKAYSKSSKDAQSELTPGQVIDQLN